MTAGAATTRFKAATRFLLGADGADDLEGGAGDKAIAGGLGDDTVDGGLGSDILSGQAGRDTLADETRATSVTVTFDGLANDGEARRV